MTLSLQRLTPIHDGVLGSLALDGEYECVTLERKSKEIPPGRYRLLVTPSARSLAGKLWSPHPDHLLPLLMKVPGREGIRIHAANFPEELEGCIAVGKLRIDGGVRQSRAALTPLLAKLMALPEAEMAWITITDPV